jgi:UDP-glucose 4-epimerase
VASLNVLVTGGAGFIGSHIVDKLVAESCDIVVLDDLSTGRIVNIEAHVVRKHVRFVKGSILDETVVADAIDNVDAVVHLAAIVSVPFSIAFPEETRETNVSGTAVLLDQCVAHGVKKFVYASSCAVYGEAKYTPIDEAHPTDPMSPYAASKLAAERLVLKHRGRELQPIALRLFNVYGPRQVNKDYAGVIRVFRERLEADQPLVVYGDGLQTRDFVYVSDISRAFWLAMTREGQGALNISSGKAVTIKQLVEVMAELAGIQDVKLVFKPRRRGDILRSHGTYARANEALGYRPMVNLRSGLRKLMEEWSPISS